jgi:hypothetical protein
MILCLRWETSGIPLQHRYEYVCTYCEPTEEMPSKESPTTPLSQRFSSPGITSKATSHPGGTNSDFIYNKKK